MCCVFAKERIVLVLLRAETEWRVRHYETREFIKTGCKSVIKCPPKPTGPVYCVISQHNWVWMLVVSQK